MSDTNPANANFTGGVPLSRLPGDGMVQGTVDGEDALLIRHGNEFFAVGAHCTHYQGPLAEGLVAGDQLRCPLHHACFSLRTGEALCAPAFDPIPCWRVELSADRIFVREKLSAPMPESRKRQEPASIVIAGGGAAGFAAAEMLRRQGYSGSLAMISADDSTPYDRPNVSKDYLAGTAPEEYMPLRPPGFYSSNRIELVLNTRVSRIGVPDRRVHLEGGTTYEFGALLLATGADPVKLSIPGAEPSRIFYLRSYSDSRALVGKANSAKRVLIIGASFIGLEAAASLRQKGLEVHLVAPDKQPFERTLGTEVGRFMRGLHESNGVVFHLGETVARLDRQRATLSGGSSIEADIVVAGVGVKPSLALAEQAGLKVDNGVLVNEYLETSVPGIFAAGDIARWPYQGSGELARVEHWVVAERQGQVAAKNMLGMRQAFDTVPFFWTHQFDVSLNYVGYARQWDAVEIAGDLNARDCTVMYKRGGKVVAVATIGRDLASLQAEAAMQG